MALFLESVESTVSAKYNGKDLTEMLCEGIAIGDEMLALNEAIYKADFIIHQRTRNLSESAQLLQEAGFLSTVWEKTKALVTKVWEWIKATWTKFVAKVTEWASRIGDRLTGNTKPIAKSRVKRAEIIEAGMEKFLNGMASETAKISASKESTVIQDGLDKAKEEAQTIKEKLEEADKLEGMMTVSATFYKKINDTAKRIQKAVLNAIKVLEKLSVQLTKDAADLSKETADGGDSAKLESATVNLKLKMVKDVTTELKTFTSATISTFGGLLTGASGTDMSGRGEGLQSDARKDAGLAA